MAKPHQSIRIFKSDLIEWFTHVHPITPLLFWAPVITWLFYRGFATAQLNAWMIGALAVSGLFIWTVTEYGLHRFVFHYPATSEFGKRVMYIVHGLHHEDPIDPTRLVMPPFGGVLIASILYAVFHLFLGPVYISPFFAGFLIGYLCYDYTHFAVHHFTPRTRFGKYVKQSHMNHHYVTPDIRWGVSSPLWDLVFGTYEESTSAVPEQHGS
jgi:sterol desaturase/sphingolipid hydroxylase (fatty acid hydroxylase superfamily)